MIEKAQTHVTLFLIYILKCNPACAVQASHITTHERKAGNDDGENKFAYKYESWEKLVVERVEGVREEEECGFFTKNNIS